MSDVEPKGFHRATDEQARLVMEMMNAFHNALQPFRDNLPLPLVLGIAAAAAARFAGAQHGVAAYINLSDMADETLEAAATACAVNFHMGIRDGLEQAKSATAAMVGAVQ